MTQSCTAYANLYWGSALPGFTLHNGALVMMQDSSGSQPGMIQFMIDWNGDELPNLPINANLTSGDQLFIQGNLGNTSTDFGGEADRAVRPGEVRPYSGANNKTYFYNLYQ